MVYRMIKQEPEPEMRPFFAGFRGFDQDPSAPISLEFARLTAFRGWKPGSKNWRKNWNACIGAEYDRLVGDRATRLETWQGLCSKVGLDDDLPSIRKCRMALDRVYVNLVDLLDCWDTGRPPKQFANVQQLSKYTKNQKKFFSRDVAKQDRVLRVLLKKLL